LWGGFLVFGGVPPPPNPQTPNPQSPIPKEKNIKNKISLILIFKNL